MRGERAALRAQEFLELAELFYKAYRDLPDPGFPKLDWPRYFLLCHCIELSLKAYLAGKGVSDRELSGKKFGHNLKNLFDAAVERDLSLTAHACRLVKYLEEPHTDYAARYPRNKQEKMGAPVPTIAQLQPDAVALLRQIATHLRGDNYRLLVDDREPKA
jgi:hypothetical protein